MSGEHVWPAWVQNVIPKRSGLLSAEYIWSEESAGEPREIKRRVKRKPSSFVLAEPTVRRVCRPCNTGWMSDIEGDGKSAVKELVRGEPKTLSPNDCRKAATWGYLKGLVADLAASRGTTVPAGIHEWFRKHRSPPSSALITLAHYSGIRHPLYCATGRIPLPGEADTDRSSHHPVSIPALVLTVGVGHFVVRVIDSRISVPTVYELDAEDHSYSRVAWPVPSQGLRWPPPSALTDESLPGYARCA